MIEVLKAKLVLEQDLYKRHVERGDKLSEAIRAAQVRVEKIAEKEARAERLAEASFHRIKGLTEEIEKAETTVTEVSKS